MTRAERKASSEVRRKTWQLDWIEIGEREVKAGRSVGQAINAISVDAAFKAAKEPQRTGEIERALAEFASMMRRAANRTAAMTP